MNKILQCATFATAMLVATSAFAKPALVTTDLNLRRGPGTGYRVITAMPNGAIVDVHGCVRGYNWCRVDWRGYDGWASARYLAFRSGRYSGRVYSDYGSSIGIPLIAGAIIGGALLSDHHPYYHHHWRHHHRRWVRHHWRHHPRWSNHRHHHRRHHRHWHN